MPSPCRSRSGWSCRAASDAESDAVRPCDRWSRRGLLPSRQSAGPTSRRTPRACYCLHRAFMTPGEQRVSVSTGISCALGGIRTPSLLIRRKVLADQPVLPGAPAWDESPGHRDTVPRAVPLNRPCRSEPCAARYKSRYKLSVRSGPPVGFRTGHEDTYELRNDLSADSPPRELAAMVSRESVRKPRDLKR